MVKQLSRVNKTQIKADNKKVESMITEKELENKIKRFLADQGAYYFKHFGCKFSKAGVPDIIACLNGRFVGIEVKREDGKVSEIQKYHLDQIKSQGGVALIVKPSNFDGFVATIEDIKNAGIVSVSERLY